jgi:hypothetical protein
VQMIKYYFFFVFSDDKSDTFRQGERARLLKATF